MACLRSLLFALLSWIPAVTLGCEGASPDGAGAFGGSFTATGEPRTRQTASSLRISMIDTGSGPSAMHGNGNGNAGGRAGERGPKSFELREAVILVDNVTAHASGGWVTVREGVQVTVDVLRLADYAVELGFSDLPAGKITQIRLHVDESRPPFVTLPDGTSVPLKVPSGSQSGLKIKGLWGLEACQQLSLTLDMDAKKSIWIHPNGHEDLWILRPVIRAGSRQGPIAGCDPNDMPGGDPNDPNNPADPNDPTTPSGGDPAGDPSGGDPAGDPSDPGSGADPSDPTGGGGTGDPTDPNGGGGTGDPTDPTGGGGTGDPNDPSGGGGTGDPNDPSGGGGTGDPTDPDGGGGATDPSGGGNACSTSADCAIDAYCSESGLCVILL